MYSIPLLEVIRRRTRHAWLLHAWLIFSLLLMPAGRLARADGEEDVFVQTGSESSVSVNVWAPEGTAGMQPGTGRQVLTFAQLNTWEVWTGSLSGTVEYRNPISAPLGYTGISFSISGDGTVSGGGMTDGNGNAIASFTMGNGASTVTATVDAYGATGSVTFDPPEIVETWIWHHDESLIAASLGTSDSTDSVPNGATRQIQAHVDLTTWSVYVSNFGNTKTENLSTSPAIGASVSWIMESGDGSVGGSSSTDGMGNAAATFTMGTAASVVRADVSYATSSSTYATLGFTPAPVTETWAFDHVETSLSGFTFSANGSTDALAPGTQRTVTATVTNTSVEVWVSNLGNVEYRNHTTVPAQGESVSFSLDSGDGSLSGVSATTDSNGNASVDFTMGSTASQVTAGMGGYSASINFYPAPEVWTYDHMASALSFANFTADGSVDNILPGSTRTLTAEVTSNTWEVWVSNYGNTENRNPSSGPPSGVTVGFVVETGDGQLSTGSGTTDGSGHASVGFTMGASAASPVTVRAEVNDGANGNISTTITLTPGQPVWTYDHTETTIATSLSANGNTDSIPLGAVRVVTANVTFNSWEVWTDGQGNTEDRNHASGAANSASMYFYVTNGDGTLSDAQSYTDANGNATATFTMGTQASTVQADAYYATASSSGTINFTPDPWVYHHSENALSVDLTLNEPTDSTQPPTVTAAVTLTTWDVYTNGTEYENRNVSTSPSGNAYVWFSATGSVSVNSNFAYTDVAGMATTAYSCPEGGEGSITADASFMDATASDTVNVSCAPKTITIAGPERIGEVKNGGVATVQTYTITASEPSDANNVTLEVVASGQGKAEVIEGSRLQDGSTVTYKVKGTAASKDPNDVTLKASAGAAGPTPVEKTISVVVPRKFVKPQNPVVFDGNVVPQLSYHSEGSTPPWVPNAAEKAAGMWCLKTITFEHTMQVTVHDQFDQDLGSLYDGADVAEPGVGGGFVSIGQRLMNSSYQDRVGPGYDGGLHDPKGPGNYPAADWIIANTPQQRAATAQELQQWVTEEVRTAPEDLNGAVRIGGFDMEEMTGRMAETTLPLRLTITWR